MVDCPVPRLKQGPRLSLIVLRQQCCAALLALALAACGGELDEVSEDVRSPGVGQTTVAAAATDSLFARAIEFTRKGQLDSAVVSFTTVVRADPQRYEPYLGLAEIRMRQRRFADAVQHLQRARKVDGERPEARMQLARCYAYLGQGEQAIELLEDLVEELPDIVSARLLLADLLMTRRPPDPQGALTQYEAVLAIRPESRAARAGAATSRLRVGQFDHSERSLSTLVQETPDDVALTFFHGTSLYRLGRYAEAADAWRGAIDALPATSPRQAVRKWNLRLAWLAAYGEYPGDLPPQYRIHLRDRGQSSPVTFTDVGASAGVDKVDRGRGVAWLDADGDGHLDVFAAGIHTLHGLYLGDGSGGFADGTQASGLADPTGGWSATAADYDNDGDTDLYATRDAWEGRAVNSLYRNTPGNDPPFVDAAAEIGVLDPDDSFHATWADVDADGWVDLYVNDGITGTGAANKLFINQRDGTFQDRAGPMGAGITGKSLGVAFGDYDSDGDLDLYVVDVEAENNLLRNEAGKRFIDVTAEAGVQRPVQASYAPFFHDYDGDGDLDLFVSTMCHYDHFVESQMTGIAGGPRAHLYRNEAGSHFVEVGAEMGLARSFGSMGVGYGDVDYDGRVDIYLSNGGPEMSRLEPNTLYHNREDGFADITESAGVGHLGKGHGAIFADYDADGDLDLYTSIGGHHPGDAQANSLWRNDGVTQHWIGFDLVGSASNRGAMGARVVVHAGSHLGVAQVTSGDAFGSTNSPVLEFGLGSRDRVDSVAVHWPSGQRQLLHSVAIDRLHRILEP